MDKKLKVAIIGCGNISHSHTQAYQKNPNVEIVACCDINEQRAKDYAKTYNIPHAFGSVDEMLKMKEIDAVSVCVWNNGHCPETIKALNAKKHVLCEKPLAMNTEQALEMQEAAKKNNRLLMVGFVKRYASTTKVFNDFKDAGTFGDIFLIKAHYLRRIGNPGGWFADKKRSGGGPLIDLGVHIIDLSRFLLGGPKPISVYGATFNKLGMKKHIKGVSHWHPMDYSDDDVCTVEDSVVAMIRFDNGSVLEVEASFTLDLKEGQTSIEIFGDKGGALVEPNLEIYKDMNDYMVNITPVIDNNANVFGSMFQNEIDHFVDCVLNNKPCVSPVEDGVELMRILDAIYESAKTGHEVVIKR